MRVPPLRRILGLVIVCLGLLIAMKYYAVEFSRIAEIHEAIEEKEVLLQKKKENVRNYEEKVSFYKTKEGIEHLAREQYNLVTSGERVILLTSPDLPPEPPR